MLTPLSAEEEAILRQTIGLRCHRARERLGLSQRALARVMGRSPSWVREIETAQQYAPPYLIRALAAAAGVSVGWFYGEESLDAGRIAKEIVEAIAARSETADRAAPSSAVAARRNDVQSRSTAEESESLAR
ncbi:helix-turn-helix domain-containing protein [bacterium]|nr:helix-turn-helix domain-containing protein [bacterium]